MQYIPQTALMVISGLIKVDLTATSMKAEEGLRFVLVMYGSLYIIHTHGADQTRLLHL